MARWGCESREENTPLLNVLFLRALFSSTLQLGVINASDSGRQLVARLIDNETRDSEREYELGEAISPGNYSPLATSVNVLESLPRIILDSPVYRTCVVCCEDLKQHMKVLQLPCDHMFHEDCIYSWLIR